MAVNVPLGTSDRIRFDRLGDTKEMFIAPAIERLGVLGGKWVADVDESKDLIDCQVTKSPSFSGSPTQSQSARSLFEREARAS